jgi:flagellar biosynthesis protein FlhA
MSALARRFPLLNASFAVGLAGPILIVLILAMMILPLPPFLLDILFTFNIAVAMMVLLVSLYVLKPLEFAVFPTVLLVTTLLRLSLNVASTRVVLMNGHTGTDAAGKVIEAFGHFVVGGNFAVGLVVFVILVVINFIVITKGAGRIAEVSARFTLDAMPGKQMAIDADLSAGLIAEDEARRRRQEIADEADFYGAMDGASKFVRGDAIAGILILLINIVGGLAIGMLQHDLALGHAARSYVLLAIGDGLVAQIPALVISTAAGLVVSRVGSGQNTGGQIATQLLGNERALGITAGVLGAIGLIPGMPNLAFLLMGGIAAGAAWYLRQGRARRAVEKPAASPPPNELLEASWDDVAAIDPLGLEVGYRLIAMVDATKGGELLKRIKSIRKKFAQEIGFLPPTVHIRDNLELKPNAYSITLKGVEIAKGETLPGTYLAINPGHATGTLPGTATRDPAFGLPAIWIESQNREAAQAMGYTVVDAGTVVATHLGHVLQLHAAELLGRQEAQALLDHLARQAPKLVEEVVPKLLPLGSAQKVLQNLLAEGVPIRDLRTILETLADSAPRTQDPVELTAMVRQSLGRSIIQSLFPNRPDLDLIGLDPDLESILAQSMQAGEGAALEPTLANTLLHETARAVEKQLGAGHNPVLLAPDRLRLPLARMLRRALPQLAVVAAGEIPDGKSIRVRTVIGARQ